MLEDEPRTVRIAAILRDPRYQVRKRLDAATKKRYAEAFESGHPFPPVKIAQVEGRLVLVDGWHRLSALESIGREAVEAVIVPATTREALWMAAEANLANGLPLKSGEFRQVFKAYVRARRHVKRSGRSQSYREIASAIGKSFMTIRRWMQKDFPKLFKKMGGDESHMNATGGLPETPLGFSGFAGKVEQALEEAIKAFAGVADPRQRGQLISQAERLIAEMKSAENWEAPDF